MPDYAFYTANYHGNQITEADFARLSLRAETYLNNSDCDFSSVPPDTINMAVCAVAEAWQINEQGGDIASQTVGPWNRSFTQKKPKSDSQRLSEAANLYLSKYCNLAVTWI